MVSKLIIYGMTDNNSSTKFQHKYFDATRENNFKFGTTPTCFLRNSSSREVIDKDTCMPETDAFVTACFNFSLLVLKTLARSLVCELQAELVEDSFELCHQMNER